MQIARDIATDVDGAEDVRVGDIDFDGDLDIITASLYDDTSALFLNDGDSIPTWTKSVVATNADLATGVDFADLDGDGDLDIVSSSFNDDTIAWYQNVGSTQISISDLTTSSETAGNAVLTVSLNEASEKDVTVAYATSNGTATAGADYTAASGTLTIAAGATSGTFNQYWQILLMKIMKQ